MAFEEESARIAAGLTREEYDALPGTPDWVDPNSPSRSQCDIVAHFRLDNLLRAVMDDASARKARRK